MEIKKEEITLADLLKTGQKRLKEADIPDAEYDSRELLFWVFQIDRMEYLMHPDRMVEKEQREQYLSYIEKRAEHMPLQYLMGECEFMGLPFTVNRHVLIPRQDTEVLVEWILEQEKDQGVRILDMCTGSGCIAISLAKLLSPEHPVCALDLSREALLVAEENAKKNFGENAASKVHFFQSDMFEKVEGAFDVIVSNPPYIPSEVVDGLSEEVRDHEPRLALDGTGDGLFFYRILAKEAMGHLLPGGRLYLEIGHDQGETVPELLAEAGFTQIEVRKDLAGHDRDVRAVRGF
jgi:release factor glutamine methyltransferase